MQEKPVDIIKLDNGLILEIHDRSRRVAEDRWLVSFVARINIPVKPEYFGEMNGVGIAVEKIQKTVGKTVAYDYEKKRNFVVEDEKDRVFNGLKERFLTATLPYLSRTGFPRKVILSKYQTLTGGHRPIRSRQ